jgi:hypothetical protein
MFLSYPSSYKNPCYKKGASVTSPEAEFKEKYGVWDPMLDSDCNLSLSQSQLRSLAFHPNVDECRRIGNGRGRERGMEGVGADFMS